MNIKHFLNHHHHAKDCRNTMWTKTSHVTHATFLFFFWKEAYHMLKCQGMESHLEMCAPKKEEAKVWWLHLPTSVQYYHPRHINDDSLRFHVYYMPAWLFILCVCGLGWFGMVWSFFLVQGWVTHRKSEKRKISFGTHAKINCQVWTVRTIWLGTQWRSSS